jgi:xylulokinase
MAWIGIDIGTTFLKGAVLDLDAMAVRRFQRLPAPPFLPDLPPGHREIDPLQVLASVEELLSLLGGERCDGLVLCGQMHGLVLLDSAGRPLSNAISWTDQRAAGVCFDEIAGSITEKERIELGSEFRPGLPVSVLYWLKARGALPQGAIPCSLPDFVAARLCAARPCTESTNAAASGAFHLGTRGWHQGVLGKLGLERLCWPAIHRTGERIGYWNGAPCHTPVGDQQCALAGALLEAGELSVNISTGSQVAMLAEAGSWRSAACQVRPYVDASELKTVTHIPGGRAVTALIDLLTELAAASRHDLWPYIERAARAVPQTDLRADLAFYPGPCGDRGRLENLHEGNLTAGHLFRAAFESMADNYASCARRLDPSGGWRRVVFSGGLSRRVPVLREAVERRLGLPGRLAPAADETLLGLLVLALAWSGREPSPAAAAERVRSIQ